MTRYLTGTKRVTRLLAVVLAALASLAIPSPAAAARIIDLANLQGVRQNQLIGYGLVVGLDGSGDQTTQTPFTVQGVLSMLRGLGVNLPQGTSLQLKNVAAVIVTANLPPFAQPGQTIDVTVSSLGNAKSLRGGTLVLTPLKGADNQIYAMSQGNVLVGGVGAAANGSKVQVNHLSVGLITGGATVERSVPTQLAPNDMINVELHTADFMTASRVANVINLTFGTETAMAVNAAVIRVRTPPSSADRVAFIGEMMSLNVERAPSAAKVILNARTGSGVMNQAVTLEECAVSHGNLSVTITTTPVISQPGALSGGQTVQAQRSQIEISKEPGRVVVLNTGVSLADVVKALNALGATPQDLLAILQAMKAAGALRAELEII